MWDKCQKTACTRTTEGIYKSRGLHKGGILLLVKSSKLPQIQNREPFFEIFHGSIFHLTAVENSNNFLETQCFPVAKKFIQ